MPHEGRPGNHSLIVTSAIVRDAGHIGDAPSVSRGTHTLAVSLLTSEGRPESTALCCHRDLDAFSCFPTGLISAPFALGGEASYQLALCHMHRKRPLTDHAAQPPAWIYGVRPGVPFRARITHVSPCCRRLCGGHGRDEAVLPGGTAASRLGGQWGTRPLREPCAGAGKGCRLLRRLAGGL